MRCYGIINEKLKYELHCWVYAEEQAFFNLCVQQTQIDSHFHPYNYCELWARKILVDYSHNGKSWLDYKSKDDNIYMCENKHVHLVVMGLTKMGEALARETAFMAHYPNFVKKGIKTHITFVDTDMKSRMSAFIGRNQTLFQYCNYCYRCFDIAGKSQVENFFVAHENDFLDLEFEFVDAQCMGIESKKLLTEWAKDKENQFLTVAFCENEESKNYLNGYSVFEILRDIPVWVYMQHPPKHDILGQNGNHSNVQLFGGFDIDITKDPKELQWAKYVYQAYLRKDVKGIVVDDVFYSEAEKKWYELGINKRWSNLFNACSLTYKLRGMDAIYVPSSEGNQEMIVNGKTGEILKVEEIDQETINLFGEVEHNRWNVEQLLMGFRGTNEEERSRSSEEINNLKRAYIHDCIRPNSILPDKFKENDRRLLLYLIEAINKQKQMMH